MRFNFSGYFLEKFELTHRVILEHLKIYLVQKKLSDCERKYCHISIVLYKCVCTVHNLNGNEYRLAEMH